MVKPLSSGMYICLELRKLWQFTWQVCCHQAFKSLPLLPNGRVRIRSYGYSWINAASSCLEVKDVHSNTLSNSRSHSHQFGFGLGRSFSITARCRHVHLLQNYTHSCTLAIMLRKILTRIFHSEPNFAKVHQPCIEREPQGNYPRANQ